MKKIILILIICLLLTTTYAQEISIDTKKVESKGELKVNVDLNANNTMGASFDLIFDKNILETVKVEEGDFMKKCKSTTFNIRPPVVSTGKIEFQDLCFSETLTGKGIIAVITFKVKSSGESNLVLQNAYVFDKNGNPMQNTKLTNRKVDVNANDTYYPQHRESNNTNITKTLNSFDAFISPNHPSEGETVEIIVFSEGKPLSNVSVTYDKNTQYTNEEGMVKFVAVSGNKSILIKKDGYEDKEIPLHVSSQSHITNSGANSGNVIFIIILAIAILLIIIIAYKKLK